MILELLAGSRRRPCRSHIDAYASSREDPVESCPTLLQQCAACGDDVEFVVICTGAPHRGMGWYHATQLLAGEVSGARLTAVVEPWFLGDGAAGEHGPAFAAFRAEAEQAHGVSFFRTVEELQPRAGPRVKLIAARADDFPPLFHAALAQGFDHIYLEKPGAPDVRTMEAMAAAAAKYSMAVSRYIQ